MSENISEKIIKNLVNLYKNKIDKLEVEIEEGIIIITSAKLEYRINEKGFFAGFILNGTSNFNKENKRFAITDYGVFNLMKKSLNHFTPIEHNPNSFSICYYEYLEDCEKKTNYLIDSK